MTPQEELRPKEDRIKIIRDGWNWDKETKEKPEFEDHDNCRDDIVELGKRIDELEAQVKEDQKTIGNYRTRCVELYNKHAKVQEQHAADQEAIRELVEALKKTPKHDLGCSSCDSETCDCSYFLRKKAIEKHSASVKGEK